MSNQKTGFFAVSYKIKSVVAYEPTITLHLIVDAEKQTVSGSESLTINLVDPRVVTKDLIHGNFVYETGH